MRRSGGALFIWNDIASGMEHAFRTWHDQEHIPERMRVPGFLSGRRFFAAGATPRWLTLYEAQDAAVFSSHDYLARLNAPTPRTAAMLPHFRETQRMAGHLVASAGGDQGDAILTARVWLQGEPPPDNSAVQTLVDELAADTISAWAVLADDAATGVTTTERRLRRPDQAPPDLVFVVERHASGTFPGLSRLVAMLGSTRKQIDRFDLEIAHVAS